MFDWTIAELEIIDRETQKMLQQYHVMHSQRDVNWLYLPEKNGGRELINITKHYKNVIINFGSCHLNSEEQFMKVTSNLNVTLQKKVMNQKAHQYCDKIGHETQQLAAMRKLL